MIVHLLSQYKIVPYWYLIKTYWFLINYYFYSLMFLFSFPRVLLYLLVSGNYFTIISCAAGDSLQAFSDPSGLRVTSSAPPWWTAVITTTSQSLTAPLPTSPASPVWPHSLSASPALLLPRQPYLGPTPPARSVQSVQSGFVQQCWTR